MKDSEINALLAKGFIHIRVIFEMAGYPKEHVEGTLKKYISAVKEDPEFIFMNEHSSPAEEHDNIWSIIHEADVLVANFEKLNILCFNLGPASIEVIAPDSFTLASKEMTYLYNDLLSRLHEVSNEIKSVTSEGELLKKNLNRSIRNCVTLALSEPRNMDELSLKVGIDKEHLQPFIDAMMKETFIKLEEDKYALNK